MTTTPPFPLTHPSTRLHFSSIRLICRRLRQSPPFSRRRASWFQFPRLHSAHHPLLCLFADSMAFLRLLIPSHRSLLLLKASARLLSLHMLPLPHRVSCWLVSGTLPCITGPQCPQGPAVYRDMAHSHCCPEDCPISTTTTTPVTRLLSPTPIATVSSL
ncbi:hypothetical protein IWZ03DRAFT_377842 [Phyllosticta citriasiana]|uniref:Uncharacterized protein n=1 Tax=Phyllosticta citriasiana TaxID=595635 RepID=A0ABR1KJT3_9PEZI